jgi:hypothetical protein
VSGVITKVIWAIPTGILLGILLTFVAFSIIDQNILTGLFAGLAVSGFIALFLGYFFVTSSPLQFLSIIVFIFLVIKELKKSSQMTLLQFAFGKATQYGIVVAVMSFIASKLSCDISDICRTSDPFSAYAGYAAILMIQITTFPFISGVFYFLKTKIRK